MVMSTLWSPSRVEMRTAWLEVLGTGACSGREYRSARERRLRENTPPSPTGTHTHALAVASMLTFIPVLFVSPSPISSPPPVSRPGVRHPASCPSGVVRYTCPLLSPLVHHLYTPPPSVYCICTAPPLLCQNGVYGASNRLHQWPEVHHRAPGRRRRERLR